MNRAALEALRRHVRPVSMGRALTLAQAAAAVELNRDVARFHAALAQAERILAIAGVVDERLAGELTSRGAQLVQRAEVLARPAAASGVGATA